MTAPKRDLRLYLDDIVDSIDKIRQYTEGVNEEAFSRNTLLQDAVLRRIEIIGEAVKHIPKRVRDQHPNVPWRQIAGMRDVLAHGYFGIRLQSAWKVAQDDLPDLRDRILAVRNSLG